MAVRRFRRTCCERASPQALTHLPFYEQGRKHATISLCSRANITGLGAQIVCPCASRLRSGTHFSSTHNDKKKKKKKSERKHTEGAPNTTNAALGIQERQTHVYKVGSTEAARREGTSRIKVNSPFYARLLL